MSFIDDLFSVAGKTALVTGAATGIGRMAATALVQGGAKGLIASRKGGDCEKTASELNALGASGSAGASIDTGEAEKAAKDFAAAEKKVEVTWSGPRAIVAKNRVKLLLNLFGDGQHRRGAERVTGMYAHRVNVLDEANGDHVALCIMV